MCTIPQPMTDHSERLTLAYATASPGDTFREAGLIQRCKAGDTDAWDTLIGRYTKFVYNLAYSFCRNQEDAGDIAAQVFLRIYQSLHTLHNESRFVSWLFRIVSNTYLDVCIRHVHRGHLSLNSSSTNDGEPSSGWDIPDPAPSPETICLENETVHMLAEAIRHLPTYQRQVMRMYLTEGKSYLEIAEVTGLCIGTVKSRLNRARAILRERLATFQETLPIYYASSTSPICGRGRVAESSAQGDLGKNRRSPCQKGNEHE